MDRVSAQLSQLGNGRCRGADLAGACALPCRDEARVASGALGSVAHAAFVIAVEIWWRSLGAA
jgi:hypothetical protein